MEYQVEHNSRVNHGYSTSVKVTIRQVQKSVFMTKATDISDRDFYGSVSTVVERGWFGSRHLMVLDCDSTDRMLAARAMLSRDGIPNALVQSSPSKYWVVTDYVERLDDVIAKMKSIPGADNDHIDMAAKYKTISLRAIAYPGRVPIFPGCDELKDPRSIRFYRELEEHFQHPTIKRRLYAEILMRGIKDGKMVEMVSNPAFVL